MKKKTLREVTSLYSVFDASQDALLLNQALFLMQQARNRLQIQKG